MFVCMISSELSGKSDNKLGKTNIETICEEFSFSFTETFKLCVSDRNFIRHIWKIPENI